MSQILDLLYEAFPNLDEILWEIGFIVMLFGIAEAFLGYRLFLKLMSIIGFLIGGFLGLLVFIYAGNSFYDSGKLKIYMLIGAVIGAVVANTFYKLSVFIGVFACSFFFFFLLTQNTTVSLVLGVICGVIGVIIDKYCIIVTTGLAGGKLAAMGIWFIKLSEGEYGRVGLFGWIIGIGGIVFQIWWAMRNPTEEVYPGTLGIDILDIVLLPCFLIYSAGKWVWNYIKGLKTSYHSVHQQKQDEMHTPFMNHFSGLPPKQRFCSHCGAKMSDNARFCSKCGTARRL